MKNEWELAKQMLAGAELMQKDFKWKILRKMPIAKLIDMHKDATTEGYVVDPPHSGWTFYIEDVEKIYKEKLGIVCLRRKK